MFKSWIPRIFLVEVSIFSNSSVKIRWIGWIEWIGKDEDKEGWTILDHNDDDDDDESGEKII